MNCIMQNNSVWVDKIPNGALGFDGARYKDICTIIKTKSLALVNVQRSWIEFKATATRQLFIPK